MQEVDKPEHVLIARLAADLLAWIDSEWVIGMIRSSSAVDVIGVYAGSGNPAIWQRYVDSISICARSATLHLIDSELRCPDRTRVVLPVETDGELVAVLAIGPRSCNGRRPYSESDVQVMRDLCAQMGYLLRSRTAVGDYMEASKYEAGIVHGIQDRLYRTPFPQVPGIECSAQCERSGRLGGDFFDLSGSVSSGLMASIGNVAVSGNPGCILMTGLQACLRCLGRRATPLSDLFEEMNGMFWQIAPENTSSTLFSARIDPARRRLHYVNAGHQTSLIIRRGGRIVDRLESNAPVLGLSRRSVYRARTLSFCPGDTLIAISDGAEDPDHEAALIKMAQNNHGARVRELPARLIDRAVSSTGSRLLDRTVVVVRFNDAAEEGIGRRRANVEDRAMAAA